MHCSALGSKTLIVAKVDEILSDTEAKIQIYEKRIAGNKLCIVCHLKKFWSQSTGN